MPTYDYHCTACGHVFEAIHRIADPSPESCPACGERAIRKALVAPTVVFRGSGWAKKDRVAASARRPDGGSTDGKESDGKGAGDDGSKGSERGDRESAKGSERGDRESAKGSERAAKSGGDAGSGGGSGGDAPPSTGTGSRTAAPAATD
jgi:putative FmdB family regulatory protein